MKNKTIEVWFLAFPELYLFGSKLNPKNGLKFKHSTEMHTTLRRPYTATNHLMGTLNVRSNGPL